MPGADPHSSVIRLCDFAGAINEALIRHDRKVHTYDPRVLASLGERGTGDPNDLYFLGGMMGEYYVLQNMSYPWMRMVVGFCYLIGSVLLFIPTAWTYGQVFYQVARLCLLTTAN